VAGPGLPLMTTAAAQRRRPGVGKRSEPGSPGVSARCRRAWRGWGGGGAGGLSPGAGQVEVEAEYQRLALPVRQREQRGERAAGGCAGSRLSRPGARRLIPARPAHLVCLHVSETTRWPVRCSRRELFRTLRTGGHGFPASSVTGPDRRRDGRGNAAKWYNGLTLIAEIAGGGLNGRVTGRYVEVEVQQVMADFFDSERAEQRKARAVRKPWWQLSKTVRQGFVISAVYFFLGIGALIIPPATSQPVGSLAIGAALWLTFGACHLISALVLRSRSQAESPRSKD
jgi:hypothetical protein